MTGSPGIPHIVSDIVQSIPEKIAVCHRHIDAQAQVDETYSYGQLWECACSFAVALEPIQPGSHVMLVMPLGIRLLAAHLGIQLQAGIGSIFTHPSEKVHPEIYRRNLSNTINILKPDAIITIREYADFIVAALNGTPCRIITEENASCDSDYEPLNWKTLESNANAVIQFSSGSTGLQKSVALTHEMVAGQCNSYSHFIGLHRDMDHICSWLPLYHDMGLFTTWLMPLLKGVSVSFIDPFKWVKNPGSFLKLISDVRGTLCWQPNFAFNLLASRASNEDLSGIDLSSLRGVINCSEPVSAKSVSNFYMAFKGAGIKEDVLWTCYAMAENAFAVTASGGPREKTGVIQIDAKSYSKGNIQLKNNGQVFSVVSCGIPIDGCHVKIVDGRRRPVSEGLIGEISINSPYMLREYLRNPAATEDSIDKDNWFYTGDLGFMLDKRLYVTGRKKDLIIIGGRNFYPQDIEAICDACEGAIPGRSVALGVEDENLGTQTAVVIVESRLTDPIEKSHLSSSIRRAVYEELDCPVSEVVVVPHMWLVKTSSGKIARQQNLKRYKDKLHHTADNKVNTKFIEKIAWAFSISLLIYMYLLLFVLSTNDSWNIYVGL